MNGVDYTRLITITLVLVVLAAGVVVAYAAWTRGWLAREQQRIPRRIQDMPPQMLGRMWRAATRPAPATQPAKAEDDQE